MRIGRLDSGLTAKKSEKGQDFEKMTKVTKKTSLSCLPAQMSMTFSDWELFLLFFCIKRNPNIHGLFVSGESFGSHQKLTIR